MTLRRQIVTTVGLTLVGGVIVIYGTIRGLILHNFAQLEETLLRTDMERAREAVLWELQDLDKTGNDWGGWDETRDFVETGDPGFISRNLMDQSLTNLRVNFMAFLNDKNEVVYCKTVELTSGTAARSPDALLARVRTDARLTHHKSPTDSKTGILLLPEGPALIAAWPISNNENTDPVHGTMVLGRYLDSPAVAEIADRTLLDLEILRADMRPFPPGWEDASSILSRPQGSQAVLVPYAGWISGYEVLPDVHGSPGLILRIAMKRTILARGQAATGYFLAALAVVGVAMLAVVLSLLRRFVVGPVVRLTRHAALVGEQRDLQARIRIDSPDELATLGNAFNTMLDALHRAMDDLRRAEEATRLQQQQLVRADRLKSLAVLVSGVAHEINNPNQIVQSHVAPLVAAWERMQPILDRYYEENGDFDMGGMNYEAARTQVPAMLASIQTGSSRIKAIVEDLRDFAREQSAELEDGVDLNRVVQSAAMLLSNMTRKATDRFVVECAEGLPPVRGSHQRLEQVAINLIQNALQSLPDPSRGVTVRTSYDAPAHAVVLEVRDEGVGIEPANLERVQDPFFTTRREQGGTGLGLSICASIVMDHGGTLRLESEPGQGTTARVTLPVQKEEA